MRKSIVLVFIVILFQLTPSPIGAGNLNPGIVNLEVILNKANMYNNRLTTLQRNRKYVLRQLDITRKKLQTELKKLPDTTKNLPPDVRRDKLILYRKFKTLERRRKRLEQFHENRRETLKKNLLKHVKNHLQNIAQERRLNIIFNGSAEQQFRKILWTSSDRNLTRAVLRYLNSTRYKNAHN